MGSFSDDINTLNVFFYPLEILKPDTWILVSVG